MDFPGKKDKVIEYSQHKGLQAATITGVLASGAVYAAHHFSPLFRTRTNVSARVALAVSPAFFAYIATTESTMVNASRDPEAYGIFPAGHVAAAPTQTRKTLAWYHKAANAAYQHPFGLIGGAGIPAVGAIFWAQSKDANHLKFSQKVMHTRVLGQMTILGVLVGTMAFRDWMYKNGGLYLPHDPEEEVHRADEGHVHESQREKASAASVAGAGAGQHA